VFGGVKIGNHSIAQRPYSFDIFVRLAVHLARLFANGDRLAGVLVNSHDRGLVHHNFVVVDNDGVSGPQVNC
jgi:hypothetical protein